MAGQMGCAVFLLLRDESELARAIESLKPQSSLLARVAKWYTQGT